MGTPYIGEIKIVAFNFPPQGWAECDGQFLPINQNQALFSLLGTTYGGNGQTTFALPNLKGRTPIHRGNEFFLGQQVGTEAVTLVNAEMPGHNHVVYASSANATTNNTGSVGPGTLGYARAGTTIYGPFANPTALLSQTVSNSVGGSQAHENRQPYMVLMVCIALQGAFPSQS
jgi:microcystin-dependent protein